MLAELITPTEGYELRPEQVVRPDLFWSKVAKADGCWEWTAKNRFRCGYGKHSIKRDGKRREGAAHRIAYVLATNSPIPAGMHVLHSCDNRLCCNPEHLRLGTRSENIQDAWDRGQRSRIRERGADNASSKAIYVGETYYASMTEAAAALGINYHTVAARARYGRFGYRYAR